MTREEQIEKTVSEILEERQTAVGRKKYGGWYFVNWFKEGVKWADEHPKSPWISVEDDLPYNHQELMKNDYFTVRVFTLTDDKTIYVDSMVKESSGWKWVNAEFNYKYWMPMPELPKE